MRISLIWAMAENRVIGIENRLPWKLSGDLKYFKQVTMGKPIVMGRKTFESFGGRTLPGRQNIIITRDQDYSVPDATVVHSVQEAIDAAGDADELMIIGGANLYAQTLPVADRLYMTLVHAQVEGDAYFPEFPQGEWALNSRADYFRDEKNQYDYSFLVYDRLDN